MWLYYMFNIYVCKYMYKIQVIDKFYNGNI